MTHEKSMVMKILTGEGGCLDIGYFAFLHDTSCVILPTYDVNNDRWSCDMSCY